jgi:hypothetical protein
VAGKPLIASFGKLPVDAVTSSSVEKFKLTRSQAISPAGTNRDLAALRLMLNFAIRLGYIARNPVTGVRFLPEPPGSMRIISHDEQMKYLKATSHLLRDVATLMLGNGDASRGGVHDPKGKRAPQEALPLCAERKDAVRPAQCSVDGCNSSTFEVAAR